MKVPSQRDNLISLCPGLEGTKPGLISSFLPSSSCPASSMVKAGPGTQCQSPGWAGVTRHRPPANNHFGDAYKHFQPSQRFIFKLFIRHLKSSCSICRGLRVSFHREDVGRHGNGAENRNPGARGRHCIAQTRQQRLT